jgi:hypothetical protein
VRETVTRDADNAEGNPGRVAEWFPWLRAIQVEPVWIVTSCCCSLIIRNSSLVHVCRERSLSTLAVNPEIDTKEQKKRDEKKISRKRLLSFQLLYYTSLDKPQASFDNLGRRPITIADKSVPEPTSVHQFPLEASGSVSVVFAPDKPWSERRWPGHHVESAIGTRFAYLSRLQNSGQTRFPLTQSSLSFRGSPSRSLERNHCSHVCRSAD